jgi:hypothetical protein
VTAEDGTIKDVDTLVFMDNGCAPSHAILPLLLCTERRLWHAYEVHMR